ncbi:MAG: hypothetical protein LVR00_06225 [Rhabdochlamydiaceae bacterium]|jgi:hypothetical protein
MRQPPPPLEKENDELKQRLKEERLQNEKLSEKISLLESKKHTLSQPTDQEEKTPCNEKELTSLMRQKQQELRSDFERRHPFTFHTLYESKIGFYGLDCLHSATVLSLSAANIKEYLTPEGYVVFLSCACQFMYTALPEVKKIPTTAEMESPRVFRLRAKHNPYKNPFTYLGNGAQPRLLGYCQIGNHITVNALLKDIHPYWKPVKEEYPEYGPNLQLVPCSGDDPERISLLLDPTSLGVYHVGVDLPKDSYPEKFHPLMPENSKRA